MMPLKLNGQFSSKSGFYLNNARLADQLLHFPSKSKGESLAKFSVSFAKLHDAYEPASIRWKICTYDDTVNGVTQKYLSNFLPESPFVRSGGSRCKSEEDLSSHEQGPEFPANHLAILTEKLKAVHLHLLASEHWNASQLKLCHGTYLASAKNLTHYLALQCLDVQQVEESLSSIGLLNLESMNSHILASINSVIQLLEDLVPIKYSIRGNTGNMDRVDYVAAEQIENQREYTINTMSKIASSHASRLFGPSDDGKHAHIMVTVGREVISNETLLMDILKAGANIIRINCAHDDPTVWSEIVRMAKHSSQILEKPCRILMDLAGPKLRTGYVVKDAIAMRITPQKDANSDMIFPAHIWLCSAGSSPPSHLSQDAIVCIDQEFFNNLKVGDVLSFVDVRGRKRSFKLLKKYPVVAGSGYMVECSRTAYIGLGTKLFVKKDRKLSVGQVVKLPSIEEFIMLKVGDLLTISRNSSFSMDKPGGTPFGSARITCSSDHLFDSVKPGEPVAFDDGKIWGKVQKKNIDEIIVLVTHASPEGSRLGSRKSINIPRSEMQLKGLTSKDLVDLDFVAAHADMVGISFLRDVDDIVTVQHELEKRKLQKLGVVLKIETSDALEKLPQLLFQAMQFSNPLGVMIARGDLMVECGWDQMADIQQEIMSVCSAAHIPVIWATQVLESLVKFGLPTRAEITDAASGSRANCVMLNKGEHIVQAVVALDSLMSKHSTRKNKKMLLNPLLPSN
ncbi:plastidial pyruvate kinase 4, chloroplastic-like isoform X1 [Phoenix dactylifera]|uniref:pyruvate kinase n=2 Tax=Phoenix dactylifera TaxID=42345 RepID=A0A8B9AED2_PHODC|nr:plastidial pyruvate kinase 4, chloroplastic-like isoform X1 [Phoenix dactylifera]XP_038985075.1 plastidial pyruvate kinase 4, chloroplastic-like isoform X1 [Phoenix dactylifera]XP_038985076.1 plastidial pyruvate kinase 4, chloroplastic-like isoform X1 [Phoenix dactylifera]